MTAQIKILASLVILALGAAAGWVVNGWRAEARIASLRVDHAQVLADIATKTASTMQAVQRAGAAANAAIQAADEKSTKGISDAKAETDRLRACVAAGTCGVRIVTRYVREPGSGGAANPGTSGVVHAAIELDRETASRFLDLRESVEFDAEKLGYLQRYAEACFAARLQVAE
ncbi:lysis protein [Diaphorobacter ruginosibacter]|uniref:Lysis protein n=1 Tax=Diaphorobacter ruginosibacter TaxID=1715720 RepID=A0A7G9RLK9_9BURK|nr:lysis system i-spanin subunit Rz [Diaphorobacter ruginosibacter]QNN56484.1 lysis protein [Diaphorobacter ruginosibacter]